MMKRGIQFFLFGCAWLVLGCQAHEGFKREEYKEQTFDDLAEDFKVPSKLLDIATFTATKEAGGEKAEGKKEEKKEEGKGGESAAAGGAGEVVFGDVTVYLVEKNPDIIHGEAVKIKFPRGGGVIDLAQYVSTQAGSYFVGFDVPDFQDATDKKVIFLSDAKKRKVDGEVLGAGCNQYLDITNKFMKSMQTGVGIKVNTTRERDVTVLGGKFILSAKKADGVHITQVSFTDSRYKNLFCGAM
jgi:hypothetical protein